MTDPQRPGASEPPLSRSLAAQRSFDEEAEGHDRRDAVLGMVRLVAALGVVVGIANAFSGGGELGAPLAIAGGFCFVALGVAMTRIRRRRARAQARSAVHGDRILRMSGRAGDLPPSGSEHVPALHPYAGDLDLAGPASLLQRIDTTKTVAGERTLTRWLLRSAAPEVIEARQAAIQELIRRDELRVSLEAEARMASGEGKLDAAPFLEFTRRENQVAGSPLAILSASLPIVLLALFVAQSLGMLPSSVVYAGAAVVALVALAYGSRAAEAFELIAARRGYLEAYANTLRVTEAADFEDPLLRGLRESVYLDGRAPSEYLGSLDRWAGLAEFRHQGPVHFFVNLVTLWDLNVLAGLERWNLRVGAKLEGAFDALGELEALAALATYAESDPGLTFPSIEGEGGAVHAEGLAHPLLLPDVRVANDVSLGGPGHALIITGSNMAGKSTLLRSLGLNTALALAGGPVVASRFSLPRVRLRASMRVDDSLQRGASYFHAELQRLETVVSDAEAAPPILFLLDELLRGTNARARHLGARAVLAHLLDRGGMGLAATHDIALSELEEEREGVGNAHFTDVIEAGEMIFDYRLRPGVVKTSNALRLLGMAGIDVPDDDGVRLD